MSNLDSMTRNELRDLLRRRGIKVSVTASAEKLRETARNFGVRAPFDREARDALKPVPIPLYEHPAGARNRRQRRWQIVTHYGDSGRTELARRISRPQRPRARMRPATKLELLVAYGQVAKGARR